MSFEWSEENVAKLEELWDQYLSTAEIGRILGTTKNAVVGKAHRLGLPKRQSPVRKNKKNPKQVEGLIRLENLERGMCCWPSGDPNDEDFSFCGKKIYPGRPYCEDHCKEAYVRVTRSGKKIPATFD